MSTQTLETSARSVSARLGVLGRADGSCQWSQGNTSVLVAVWGPTAPKRAAQALPDRAFVDIRVIEDINDNANQNSNLDGRDNPVSLKTDIYSSFKSIILDTLHPRCQISIVIQVICDDGSVRPCYIFNTISTSFDSKEGRKSENFVRGINFTHILITLILTFNTFSYFFTDFFLTFYPASFRLH